MKRLLGLTLLLTCLWAGAETAIPDMKFRRLDTPDGLSSSLINCIFKDSQGYVWIGTSYGLNRYDGYRFKTFYSNRRDSTTMRNNYTDRIMEAYDGKLWLSQGMNYCVYDPKTEQFERNIQKELAKYGITGSVERLHIDSKKNFWLRIYDVGLVYYNPKTKKTKRFPYGYGDGKFSPDYGISTFAEDDNNMVIATNSGELVCLNGERGDIYWTTNYMRRNGGPENQDYRLIIDRQGNYWSCAPGCSFVFIKKENKWYNSLAEYLHSLGISDFPENLEIWDIQIDAKGWMWLACDHEGLVVVDMKNLKWKQFKNNKYDETTLSDNTLRKVYLANDGSVWIGTYKNGVCQYVPALASMRTVELGDITTACEDRNGLYWLGTNDVGLLVWNPKTDEIVAHYTAENSALTSNVVVGSWAASDGTLWFGSYNGGLTHCIPSATDPTHATVVNYQAGGENGLANNSVWALTEDKWGRIWFSTLGGGLQMRDPKTGKYVTWDTKNTKIPGDYLTSVGWNKKGWLVVGTNHFYSLVNPVSRQLINQEIPENAAVTATVGSTNYVIEDSRGLIWHGSNVGVIVFDPKTKFQKLIDMTDGLFGSGINSIIEDKKHTIWVVTDHGISNVVPSRQEDGTWHFNIRSFNSRDGLQKATYNQRSTCLTHDGKVLVGGQGGLDIIDPALLQDKSGREHPVFSGLQIFDEDVIVGRKVDGRVILSEALDACRELSLRFNEQFTIQLSTNEVNIKNATRFAYRLEGFNDNWVKTSEQNPNITYNSLRAGSYQLYVRLLNDDGSLGKEESSLSITIRPPLWRTRWMILLYMIVIALIAWLWRHRFLQRHEERVELEDIRREVEKKQWMNEMLTKMKKDAGEDNSVFQADQPWSMKPEDLNLTPGDLQQFMKEQCSEYKAPEGKKVKFSFFPLAHDLVVDFDHDMLGQAVQILLNNAVMFSPKDCRIKVFVDKTARNGSIRISDNGIGLQEGVKEHMFDPIVSDDDSGVCLSVVKDIVEAHGGTVVGDNNAGGGSVFTITLPLEHADVVEEAVLMED